MEGRPGLRGGTLAHSVSMAAATVSSLRARASAASPTSTSRRGSVASRHEATSSSELPPESPSSLGASEASSSEWLYDRNDPRFQGFTVISGVRDPRSTGREQRPTRGSRVVKFNKTVRCRPAG